jgi:hypothetical protein
MPDFSDLYDNGCSHADSPWSEGAMEGRRLDDALVLSASFSVTAWSLTARAAAAAFAWKKLISLNYEHEI